MLLHGATEQMLVAFIFPDSPKKCWSIFPGQLPALGFLEKQERGLPQGR